MNPIFFRAILTVIAAFLTGTGVFQAGQASQIYSAGDVGFREALAVSWPFVGAGLTGLISILVGNSTGTTKEVAEMFRDWLSHSKERSPSSLRRAVLSTCDVITIAIGPKFPKVAAANQALITAITEELGPQIVKRITVQQAEALSSGTEVS